MLKRKMRWFGRVVSGVLTLCLMFSGFSAGQLIVSAAELTGYRDETVVRFKNVGSGKYLNVHYGQDANEVNVYQWTADGSVEQTFKLRYNEEEDCYLIGAMCSSNGNGRVLDIVKSGGQVQAGCNVEIYNATDPVAQQWQFWYRGNGKYAIIPIANVNTLLTAYGDSNGSSGGTDPTDAGNVYLSAAPTSSTIAATDYQLWEIEEVTPQATIETGVYRIASGDNKYLTLDVEDNYNVCHVGDPSNISGLGEMEKSRLRSCQLWHLEYLSLGYYLIWPVTDSTRKLVAEGDYEMLQANVWAKPVGNPNTWHNRLQWKIVPNVAGGYRIVSKGAGLSQAMTVYGGELADFTNVQMCPYQGTTCQQWTFELVYDLNNYVDNDVCSGELVSGHAVQMVNNSGTWLYKCSACGKTFQLPQVQDYSNQEMSDERLALIFALQQTATLEMLREDRDHFAQACLKATDILRSERDLHYGESMYDFHGSNGHYISPTQYDYTAQTMTASIDVVVETCSPDEEAWTQIVWDAVGGLDFSLQLASIFVQEYLMPLGHNCTLPQLEKEVKRAVRAEKIQQIITKTVSEDLAKAMTANAYVGLLNTIINSRISGAPCISVMIRVYDGEHVDTFQGWYTVEPDYIRTIHIDEEYFEELDRPLPTYTPNRISGDCSLDGVVYSPLFP